MSSPMTILLYLLILCIYSSSSFSIEDSRESRSRIIAYNGNLMFHAGFNRNIYFHDNYNSSIFIGKFNAALLKNMSMLNISNKNLIVTKHANILHIIQANLAHESIVPMEAKNYHDDIMKIQNKMMNLSQEISNRGIDESLNEIMAQTTILSNLMENDLCLVENPCKNGGYCISHLVGYTCICPEERTGPNCELMIDQCELYEGTPKECQNNGKCKMEETGERICICPDGFYGDRCQSNEKRCQSNEDICGHGYCIDSYSKKESWYYCACKTGFHVLNETHPICVDIDECISNPCHNGVECVNLPGRFSCTGCPHGYESLGGRCVDIDECSSHNPCSKNPLVRCINTMGSFHCDHCPFGFMGDGFKCDRVNVCNANPCHVNAECFENRGELLGEMRDFVCMCKQGYMGDAYDKLGSEGEKGCQPIIIPPASNPCLREGTCGVGTKECRVIDNSTFRCICEDSHYGQQCDMPSPCYSDPCKNDGKCVALNRFQFECDCLRGFYGERCELVEDGCVYHSRETSGILDFPNEMNSFARICEIIIDPPRNESNHLGVYLASLTFPNTSISSKYCTNASNTVTIFDGVSDRSHSHSLLCESAEGFSNPEHPMTSGSVLIRVKGNGISFKLEWEQHPNWRDMKLIKLSGKSGYLHIKPREPKVVWFISAESITSSFLFEMPPFNYTGAAEILVGDRYDGELTFKESSLKDYATLRVNSPFAAVKLNTLVSCSHCQEIIIRWTTVETSSCGEKIEWNKKWPFEGNIHSPQFPKEVATHTLCTWSLNSSLPFDLSSLFEFAISFNYFDIPSKTEDCHDDFIKFTSLDSQRSVNAREICNKQPPTIGNSLILPYNSPIVTYRTSGLIGGGFSMNFRLSCDKILGPREIISTTFNSTGFPYSCTYTMEKSPNEIILIKFQYISESLICNNGSRGYDSITINSNTILCEEELEKWAPSFLTYTESIMINYRTRGLNESNFSLIVKRIPILECSSTSVAIPNGYREIRRGRKRVPMCLHHIYGEGRVTMEIANIEFPDNKTRPYTDIVFLFYDFYYDEELKGSLLKTLTIENVSGTIVSEFKHLSVLIVSASLAPEIPQFSLLFASVPDNCGLKYTAPSDVIAFKSLIIGRPCDYSIELQSTEHSIALIINSFNIPCAFGSLIIRNGRSMESPGFSVLGHDSEICNGRWTPITLRSHGNTIFMRFQPKKHFFTEFNITYEQIAGGCGGYLEGSRGEITSPQYPHESTDNYDCVWRIAVPEGNNIILEVVYMEHFEIPHCQNNSVSRIDIFDDHSISPIHRTKSFCSNISEGQISLKSSLAAVRYRQKSGSRASRGFFIQFAAFCNGIKVDKQFGTIQAPSFPYANQENRTCTWDFLSHYESKVKVIFHNQQTLGNHLNKDKIGNNDTCGGYILTLGNSGIVTLRDSLFGEITTEKRLFCTAEEEIVQIIEPSGYLSMDLQFHDTDNNLFWVSYSHEGCVHFVTSPGVIEVTVGDLHDSEMAYKPCYWNIRAQVGQKITAKIQLFESQAEKCNGQGVQSSLQVYGDLDFENSRSIFKKCSRVKEPISISSTGHEMMIYAMVEKKELPKQKEFVYFRAEILFELASNCGGQIKLSSHEEMTVIHSPGYPKSYDSSVSCLWTIEVPHGTIPQFILEHTLDENISIEPNNTCDKSNYLEKLYFESLDDSEYDLLLCDRFEGSLNHFNVKSSRVNFHFSSGHDLERFHSRTFFALSIYLKCGGVLYATNERKIYNVIHSKWDDCEFIIKKTDNSPSNTLTVTITRINRRKKLEDDIDREPFVSIDGGNPVSFHLIRDHIELEATSSIWFNVSRQYDLSIVYSLTNRACGGELYRMRGNIKKKLYREDIECIWTINNTPGNAIRIKSILDIPESPFCTLAYLEGSNVTDRLCTKIGDIALSNFGNPTIIYDKPVTITFKYHGDNAEREYSVGIHFERINGGIVTSNVIESPPVIEGSNTTWTIKTEDETWIRYEIETLELPYTYPLKIMKYDEEREEYLSIEEYRGHIDPHSPASDDYFIIESNNVKVVWIHEDGIRPEGGFRISWKPTNIDDRRVENEGHNHICGGQLNVNNSKQFVTFNSSMYDEDEIVCVWTIPRPFLKTISIEFYTNFPERFNCEAHMLSIVRNHHHVRSRDFTEGVCYSDHSERYEHIDEDMIVTFSSKYRSPFTLKLYYWSSDGSIETIPDNGRKYSIVLTPHIGYSSNKRSGYVFESSNIRLKEARLVSMHIDSDRNCSSYLELIGITTERFCESTMNSSILIPFHNELRVVHFTAPEEESRDIVIDVTKKESTCSELYVLDMLNRKIELSWSGETPVSCEWTIKCPQRHRIKFNFKPVSNILEHSYIHVYDGPSSHSNVIESFSLTSSRQIYSTSNHMHVVVEIPASSNVSITAEATIASCGGTITLARDRETILTSSNFPHVYDEEGECIWTVDARISNEEQIIIRINTLHLIPSADCQLDYIEFGPVVGERNRTKRMCGNESFMPMQLFSTGQLLIITLNANSTQAERRSHFTGISGFNISLSINEFSCGHEITDDMGVIDIPLRPDGEINYNAFCEWFFKAGPMKIYQLEIQYIFDSEDEENAMEEMADSRVYLLLQLIDGPSNKRRWEMDSGRAFTQHTKILNTMADLAILRFSFDNYWSVRAMSPISTRFRIIYTKMSSIDMHTSCQLQFDDMHINSTGPFKITLPELYQSSNYTSSVIGLKTVFCHILIRRTKSKGTTSVTLSNPKGIAMTNDECSLMRQSIQVQVPTSALSINKNICGNDFVTSSSNYNESIYQITTLSSEIDIYSYSSVSINDQLEFSLNITFNDCGGVINDPSGNLSLPRYIPNDNCQWIFEAPLGMVVSIHFTHISIEDSPGCVKDAIILGEGESNTRVRRMCYRTWESEDRTPLEQFLWKYRSRSRILVLSWITDGDTIDFDRKGWSLNYTFENSDEDSNRKCGYSIHGESGIIRSSNNPREDYAPNLACEWTISVPEGYKMIMHFNRIDIEHSNGCVNDYLKIWSEQDDHYFKIGKRTEYLDYKWEMVGIYCQYSVPSDFVVGEKARIDFVSNGKIGGKGFEISFTSICGGNYTRDSGEILSPHYPDYLPDNTNCSWLINPDFGTSTEIVTIIFEDVDLRDYQSGGQTTLELHDYSARRIIHSFNHLSEYTTEGRFTVKGPTQITFHSSNSIGNQGRKRRFRIKWISKRCDRQISLDETNEYRTVLRPDENFPIYGGYSCVVSVRTTEGRSVSVKIFNAVNDQEISCDSEFVTISTGNFTDNKFVGKYCGDQLRDLPITVISTELLIRFHSIDGHSKIGAKLEAKAFGLNLCENIELSAEYKRKKRIEIKESRETNTFCNVAIQANATSRIKIIVRNATFIETPPGRVEKETGGRLRIVEGANMLAADSSLEWASLPLTIFTSQSSARLKWNDSPGRGYSYLTYEYQAIPLECGGQLIAHRHAKFISYRSQSNISGLIMQKCQWILKSSPPAPIFLRIKSTEFENSKSICTNDEYIHVEDTGEMEHCDHPECSLRFDDRQIMRNCWRTSTTFVSRSSSVMITASTRVDMNRSFVIEYYSLDYCQRTVHLSQVHSSHITSPFFPRLFGNNTDCVTTMRIIKKSRVLFVFRYLGMHDHPDESTSLTMQSNDIVFCCFLNQSMPSPFITESDTTVHLKSKRARYGYDISYYTTFSTDPALIVFETNYDIRGVVSQPGYPNGYPANTIYRWSISPPTDQQNCALFFEDVNLRLDCSDEEYVLLSHVVHETNEVSHQFKLGCYLDEYVKWPLTIPFPDNSRLDIEFRSDGTSANDGRGFRGRWNCENFGVQNYNDNIEVYH